MHGVERRGQQIAVRNAVGKTVQRRVERSRLGVLAQSLDAERCERPLFWFEVRQDVAEIPRVERLTQAEEPVRSAWVALHLPDAREIRFAVHLRNGPPHVDLAVLRW